MKIAYDTTSIREFKVGQISPKGIVTTMTIGGRTVHPTSRFWTSLCSTFSSYGLSTKLFGLFPHHEVFDRIATRTNDRVRYALEEESGNLLAVTTPTKPLIRYDAISQVLQGREAQNIGYGKGVIQSTHTPPFMSDFKVGGDDFAHQFIMETPVDGFGQPLIYLSLLRMVCTNGAVGYARAFKTEIQIGKEDGDAPLFSIQRALDSFNNEEGFAAMRQRFEAATNSWGSVYEAYLLDKILTKLAGHNAYTTNNNAPSKLVDRLAGQREVELLGVNADSNANPLNLRIMRAFTKLTGDLPMIYSVPSLDAFQEKRMRKLPVKCGVYDLINFATEVATHHCTHEAGRSLQAWVGSMISSEYDLEGSRSKYGDFTDFFTSTDDVPSSDN